MQKQVDVGTQGTSTHISSKTKAKTKFLHGRQVINRYLEISGLH